MEGAQAPPREGEPEMEGSPHRLVADGSRELDIGSRPAVRAAVTATMLADIVRCEQRVHLDVHGDPADRAAVSGFVEMLWRQGNRHEEEIVGTLNGAVADLRETPLGDRGRLTMAAMRTEADWILGARLSLDDMEGRPDLLRRVDGVWIAGDIKAGSPWDPNGATPRLEYAVQVGFYAMLLERLRLGAGDRAFVVGSDGELAWFDLRATFGKAGRTIEDVVSHLVSRARAIRGGVEETRPALSSACGLCVWKAACKACLVQEDDLTMIPGLGRSVRSQIEQIAPTVAHLAELDVAAVTIGGGRTTIAGVGARRLATFRERARMLTAGAEPYAIRDLGLARRDVEFHLDLETDPTNPAGDFTYLHGVWRRRRGEAGDECDYVHFLAEDFASERDAFAAAVEFLSSDPHALLTTFSAFERSTYRRLSDRYPEVIDRVGVDAMFAPGKCVDLYFDAALPFTHWPVTSLGLKSLARHCGFEWSAADASGANSINWFVEWSKTREPALLDRILGYNRDDCVASAVVFDGLIALPVMSELPWPPIGRCR